MLPLMSIATIELERHVLRREVRDRLRLAVLEDVKRRLREAAHELAVSVGHRHRHLHDVDVDALRHSRALSCARSGRCARRR